jgi:hypothetical protein
MNCRACVPLALALLLPSPAARSQAAPEALLKPRAIHLRSRTFTPQAGVDARLRRQLETLRVPTLHGLVQFHDWPGLERRDALRRAGIRLLDAVPERAFFAALTRRALAALERGGDARWAGALEPRDKLPERLLKEGAPPHARRGPGSAEYVVEFFADVPEAEQRLVLRRHGAKPLVRVVEISGWRAVLPEARLARLAEEDAVKWIVPVPEPPVDDNDGVRSAAALDADPVLAPQWNLTGAGVLIGQWESTHASLDHADFAGRATLGDPPLPLADRSVLHPDSVAVNGAFDNGEPLYFDLDDSGSVSAGDRRATAAAGFAAGTTVAAGDGDAGTALVAFGLREQFADTVTADFIYTDGEPLYDDADLGFTVSAGDTRLTPAGAFAAGSVVAAGDADVGTWLWSLDIPNYHSTHVAGTALGSGARSAAEGGGVNQWKGVAPGASLRSYDSPVVNAEYLDAALAGVALSTNSWGTSHCHQVSADQCYDVGSEYYDAVISGRQSSGLPSGLARRIAIFGSSGNAGRPERHAENVAANGLFDAGETVYIDGDDSGAVSGSDSRITGPVQPAGTALVNFAADERHADPAGAGTFQAAEAVYRDADASRSVSAGDTRLTAVGAFPAGSVVGAGDADLGTALRQFRLWGNVRVPNSAKHTVEVGSISSDTAVPAASTSRGPTADGRLKPDLAGPGWQAGGDGGVTSTWPRNRYDTITGTSMSTPALVGTAALVTEWARTMCAPAGPRPDTLKALLVHAAEDRTGIPNVAGAFTGPDFAFGYGRARARQAVELLPHHRLGSLAAVGSVDTTVTIGAMAPLKVTLAWNDPPWTGNAAPSALTGLLHNDLDLLLIAPDGTQYSPWRLDPDNPFAPATAAVTPAAGVIPAAAFDRRNPLEQVLVPNAAPGVWTIRVTASSLALPPQDFVLVSEALPPQAGPCAATPAVDVWMQDNAADTGAVPSSGTMWLSPALWNRQAADGGVTHDPPEYGQPNFMYASVRNASATDTARAGSLDVWMAPAAVGLAWPANFWYLGRIAVPNLGPGETRQVGPLSWLPPDPAPSDHFCLYARLQSPQDPITFAEGASVGTNARNSNNIVWRNVNVVDLLSSLSVTFLVRNLAQDDEALDLVVRVDPALLREGQVHLRPSWDLVRAWPAPARSVTGAKLIERALPPAHAAPLHVTEAALQERPRPQPDEPRPVPALRLLEPEVTLRGFKLRARQAHPVTLTFSSPRRERAEFVVDVVQRQAGQEVGGIRYIVRTGRAPK